MTRPDDVPQKVWKVAGRALGSPSFTRQTVQARIARAIMAAETRGEERERERCAKIADEEEVRRKAEGKGIRPTSSGPLGEMCLAIGGEASAKFIATAIRKG